MHIPAGDRLLRLLLNTWTMLILPFVIANFFWHQLLEHLAVPAAVLYTGLLALYVGTKEFERWYDIHHGRHPGEWFVIAWTVVMIFLFSVSIVFHGKYVVHSDLVAVYVAVLTLYVFTHQSKQLHFKKKSLDRQEAAIEEAKRSV